MTAPRTDSRPTGSTAHAGLDADDVLEAALALVEREGGDALTMRRLASEVGVTTTTIYWHVGNRDELVVSLVGRLAERLAAAEVVGDTPHERVLCAARNIWRTALAHRNVTALASQVGATTLLELPLEVTLLAELEAAGLRGGPARDAMRAVLMCVAGFLVGAWRPESTVPPELRASTLWAGVEDPRVSAESLAAMAEPADLEPLFVATMSSVVAGFLPGGGQGPGNRPPAGARVGGTPSEGERP
jgi:TetR/AcrR family tetracycline transcriptional repressor